MSTPRYVVDTDVISETARPRPDPNVLAWLSGQSAIALASISIYELGRGVELLPSGKRRTFLEAWLGRLLAAEPTVLALDSEEALLAARLGGDARRRGHGIDEHDLFILACAKTHRLHIATRNIDHFRGRGVPTYDPFHDVYAT